MFLNIHVKSVPVLPESWKVIPPSTEPSGYLKVIHPSPTDMALANRKLPLYVIYHTPYVVLCAVAAMEAIRERSDTTSIYLHTGTGVHRPAILLQNRIYHSSLYYR
jgi:hypothetical protein